MNYSEALDQLEHFLKTSKKMIGKKKLLNSAQDLVNIVKQHKAMRKDIGQNKDDDLATILIQTYRLLDDKMLKRHYLFFADQATGAPKPTDELTIGLLWLLIGICFTSTLLAALCIFGGGVAPITIAICVSVAMITGILSVREIVREPTRSGISLAMYLLAGNKQHGNAPTHQQQNNNYLSNNTFFQSDYGNTDQSRTYDNSNDNNHYHDYRASDSHHHSHDYGASDSHHHNHDYGASNSHHHDHDYSSSDSHHHSHDSGSSDNHHHW